MLPVAVARFNSDYNAICYVLQVLWMTSCIHTERIGRMGDDAYVSSSSPDGGTGVKSAVSDFILLRLGRSSGCTPLITNYVVFSICLSSVYFSKYRDIIPVVQPHSQ